MSFVSFGERSMERLEGEVGGKIKVNFVVAATPQSVTGELEDVLRYKFVKIGCLDERSESLALAKAMIKAQGGDSLKIPFVWTRIAIQKIKGSGFFQDEILYHNFWIRDSYSQEDPVKVYELAEILYGKEAAQQLADIKRMAEHPIIKLRRKRSFNQ